MRGHELLGGILFALLLNMKHLFVYAAPIYFVYILRRYCRAGNDVRVAVARVLAMSLAVLAVFGASFGPFIAMGQIDQVGVEGVLRCG